MVRMIRAQRFDRRNRALELVAIVDEAALHRPAGGTEVLRAQLGHLVQFAARPR